MKNKFETRGNITSIALKDRDGEILEAFIDTEDLPRVQCFTCTWFARWSPNSMSYYVAGNSRKGNGAASTVTLQKYLLEPAKGIFIDHKDHDTLNNKRSNLRFVTNAENMQNRKGPTKGNISGYRGVSWDKSTGKWMAYIRLNKKLTHLGRYTDRHEAGRVALNKRMELMPYATC